MTASAALQSSEHTRARRGRDTAFAALGLAATAVSLLVLVLLLSDVLLDGWPWLSPGLVTSFPSRFPEQSGLRSALQGTAWLILLTALVSFPLGVGSAVYLEEYAGDSRWTRLIELNIANLAGVPSIIYGLLGLGVFVRALGLGRSLLAGSLTMSLLILPILIVASREAIRAIPASLRQASLALGATRWQTVRHHVLPNALPGILTGSILAMSRAIGETSVLIAIGALTFIAFDPRGPMDVFTVLPIQIFNWISLPQQEFHDLAAAAILVLLLALLSMNAAAIWLRNRLHRKGQA